MKNLLKSKLFLWGALLVFLFFAFSSGQKLYKKYLIEKEINELKKEIASLESGNRETRELINYFKTPEFKERQARSLLSLQKPGEFAVALPPRDDADSSETDSGGAKPQADSNLRLWWNYFFAVE